MMMTCLSRPRVLLVSTTCISRCIGSSDITSPHVLLPAHPALICHTAGGAGSSAAITPVHLLAATPTLSVTYTRRRRAEVATVKVSLIPGHSHMENIFRLQSPDLSSAYVSGALRRSRVRGT